MAWKCYSCGNANPNDADVCQKCGGTVAAPKSFYVVWIFGGAIAFFLVYLAGTLAGGVLVEAAAMPRDEQILAEANTLRKEGVPEFKNINTLKPEEKAAAKAIAVSKEKAKMNFICKGVLFWILPVLLFILGGLMVGFMSDGKTIIEAGIGSLVGQAGAFALHFFVLDTGLEWMVLLVGLVPGFGLAFFGAWLGETIQDWKERRGGITG